MNIADFHCDAFELRILFPSGAFDVAKFVEAMESRGESPRVDEDATASFSFTLGSDDKEVIGHGHLGLRIRNDQSGSVNITFHPENTTAPVCPDPRIENWGSWLAPYFNLTRVPAHLHANFVFDASYSSVIKLPFPLTSGEKSLAGASVTGLAILMPNEPSKTAVVQLGSDETYVFLRWLARIIHERRSGEQVGGPLGQRSR
jgi:hypothetical protein